MMQILGLNSIVLASFNLSSVVGLYLDNSLVRDDVFVGFVADAPITGIVMGEVRIDHFQYGYGAQPIPEPAVPALAVIAAAGACRRRRVK